MNSNRVAPGSGARTVIGGQPAAGAGLAAQAAGDDIAPAARPAAAVKWASAAIRAAS